MKRTFRTASFLAVTSLGAIIALIIIYYYQQQTTTLMLLANISASGSSLGYMHAIALIALAALNAVALVNGPIQIGLMNIR